MKPDAGAPSALPSLETLRCFETASRSPTFRAAACAGLTNAARQLGVCYGDLESDEIDWAQQPGQSTKLGT